MSADPAPVLIAGAGLAGLSAAYHLGARPHRLVEAEREVGGLCRSLRSRGFTFDHTGHLLHMRRPEIRALVFELLGESAFLRIDRRAGIYSHGVLTEYPFQVNTHGLPKPVVRECVMGFAETLQRKDTALGDDPSFHEWALATFGPGIVRHFLAPYNEKLYRTDLREMTADWVSWSIPKPTWTEVVRGAQGLATRAFGYNPSFLYPRDGGIDHLPKAFLERLRAPSLATRLTAIEASTRRATLDSDEVVRFSRMISTLPLPALLDAIIDAPADLKERVSRLRSVSVLNLNLGFDAPSLVPHQWIYFPEPRFPFYRVGVYSNLCPAMVPAGCASFYVEVSHLPGTRLDVGALAEASRALLAEAGLISRGASLVVCEPVEIACGYVIHDRHRRATLRAVHEYLASVGIVSVGRYGAWEYSAMEDALWHGRAAAEAVSR